MRQYIYILLMFVVSSVFGQQREQYSQYIMNNYLLNPAVGGSYTFWNARIGYRKQWVGYRDDVTNNDVGPRTMFATFHGPIGHPDLQKGRRKKKPHHGVGAYMYADKTGPISYNGLFLSYAYHHKINKKTTASLGSWVGMKEFRINGAELNFVKDPIDELIGNNRQSKFIPDMNLGLWVNNDHFFTGLSVNQLLQSKLTIDNPNDVNNEALLKYHYFYTFGWIFQLNRTWYISPSTMVKYVYPAPVQIDLNLRVMYSDFVWAGISYRNKDAINLVVEYLFDNTFEIGYAFDYTISEIRNYSSNSHEVIIGVRFGDKKRETICPAKFW